jgi:hypothetical protein
MDSDGAPRNIVVFLNSFEAGYLLSLIARRRDKHLRRVFEQLVKACESVRRDAGVEIIDLGGDIVKMMDKDGNIIVREKYDWERRDWRDDLFWEEDDAVRKFSRAFLNLIIDLQSSNVLEQLGREVCEEGFEKICDRLMQEFSRLGFPVDEALYSSFISQFKAFARNILDKSSKNESNR